jgi:hypothetical protein
MYVTDQMPFLKESYEMIDSWIHWGKEWKRLNKVKKITTENIETLVQHLILGKEQYHLPLDDYIQSIYKTILFILHHKPELEQTIHSMDWFSKLKTMYEEDHQQWNMMQPFLPSYFMFSYMVSLCNSNRNIPLQESEMQALWKQLMKQYIEMNTNNIIIPNEIIHNTISSLNE